MSESPHARFSIVVAMAEEHSGIGYEGKLPWHISTDMKYFKELTTARYNLSSSSSSITNVVIMGRKTWDSMGGKPLANRLNIVLTRDSSRTFPEGVWSGSSLDVVLQRLEETALFGRVFVIGGSELYRESIVHPQCEAMFITYIKSAKGAQPIMADVFFPDIPCSQYIREGTSRTEIDGSYTCTFQEWRRKPNEEELQYLNIIRNILTHGNYRMDRTGTGVWSKFGYTMRFDLSNGQFPLLTTKRVFFRGVVEELLWFLSGNTNARTLRSKGVTIWDGNASKQYLESIGLVDREEDDLGPIYGFQWRHSGAEYKTMHDDYTGQGVDQITELIKKIKTNPADRRLIISAWNPSDLPMMALPPCHVMAQFYVDGNRLSCQMYQRSCDMGLGVPFNIASYALLTCIIAHVCDLVPYEFIHVLGDAHIYSTHESAVKEQLKRTPVSFPILKISPSATRDFTKLIPDNFTLQHYYPLKKINMQMAV